jgi:hypothetical protein
VAARAQRGQQGQDVDWTHGVSVLSESRHCCSWLCADPIMFLILWPARILGAAALA